MQWTLDPSHLDLGFSAKHMMVATVRGQFAEVEASIDLDEERPDASRVSAVIATASLNTGNADRDAHLKSADFLDVERYPELRFESSAVRRLGDELFELSGDLTIRDVTRPVTFRGELNGPVASPWGDRRLGVSLTGEIDREEFGLTWNVALEAGGMLVSKKVRLHLEAEVVQAAVPAATA